MRDGKTGFSASALPKNDRSETPKWHIATNGPTDPCAHTLSEHPIERRRFALGSLDATWFHILWATPKRRTGITRSARTIRLAIMNVSPVQQHANLKTALLKERTVINSHKPQAPTVAPTQP